MDEDDMQQFSLRWHNHQNNIIGALSRMLSTGTLTDVILNASGTTVKAHKIVLASCSQYFAQLFKEMEGDSNTVVVVLSCDAAELRLLLTFMYTGEVTASKYVLPSLLRLAQTLKVSGLTDADTNSTLTPTEVETNENESTKSPENLNNKNELLPETVSSTGNTRTFEDLTQTNEAKESDYTASNIVDFMGTEKDRLSKLDQIVQNLYSTHKIGNPTVTTPPILGNLPDTPEPYDRKWRTNSICNICNKRLSNQYNLRVHMETHLGRRHACRACSHVSRSRDALRKHVAYRHAPLARDGRDS